MVDPLWPMMRTPPPPSFWTDDNNTGAAASSTAAAAAVAVAATTKGASQMYPQPHPPPYRHQPYIRAPPSTQTRIQTPSVVVGPVVAPVVGPVVGPEPEQTIHNDSHPPTIHHCHRHNNRVVETTISITNSNMVAMNAATAKPPPQGRRMAVELDYDYSSQQQHAQEQLQLYRFPVPKYVYGLEHLHIRPSTGCTCKKSRCLKLYCQCFSSSTVCGTNCKCNDCHNTELNGKEIDLARRLILQRNPLAFRRRQGSWRPNTNHPTNNCSSTTTITTTSAAPSQPTPSHFSHFLPTGTPMPNSHYTRSTPLSTICTTSPTRPAYTTYYDYHPLHRYSHSPPPSLPLVSPPPTRKITSRPSKETDAMIAAIAMTQLGGGSHSSAPCSISFSDQQCRNSPLPNNSNNNKNYCTSPIRGRQEQSGMNINSTSGTSRSTTTTTTASRNSTVITTTSLPKGLSFRKICSHCGRSRSDHGDGGFGNACVFPTCAKCGKAHNTTSTDDDDDDEHCDSTTAAAASSPSRMGVFCTRANEAQQRHYTALLTAWAEAATVKRAMQQRHVRNNSNVTRTTT